MIPTPNWYRDIEIQIAKLEDTVANLYAQTQSQDTEIFLLQTELKELKEDEDDK